MAYVEGSLAHKKAKSRTAIFGAAFSSLRTHSTGKKHPRAVATVLQRAGSYFFLVFQ